MQVKMRYQKASLWGEFKFWSAYKIHCYLLMEKHPWLGYLTGASLYKYTSRGTLTGFSQVVKRGQKKESSMQLCCLSLASGKTRSRTGDKPLLCTPSHMPLSESLVASPPQRITSKRGQRESRGQVRRKAHACVPCSGHFPKKRLVCTWLCALQFHFNVFTTFKKAERGLSATTF